jgi:hypothetical protein
MHPDTPRFVVTPARFQLGLALVLAFVFFMHGLAMIVAHGFGYPVAKGFVPLFHVDFEHNLPTLVALLLLLSCALTSARASARETVRTVNRRAWMLVSCLFLFLAADEAFSFHEQLSGFAHDRFADVNLPLFAWVIPYGAGVLVLGGILLRWFLELEARFRARLFVSGVIFLSGAIGLEFISSGYYESLPPDRDVYRTLGVDLLATAEEACEFAGLSLFLNTMVGYLGGVSFRTPHLLVVAAARR